MLKSAVVFVLLLLICVSQVNAGVPVFIYHRFAETQYPSTNISLDTFNQQLSYLKNEGYQVLPLSKIAQMIRKGESFPENAVGLSVDDAFSSFAEHALPLLKKYDFPVTLFVNTDAVGTAGYLDWSQLRDVLAQGVEIGNHTASHAYLVEMEESETAAQWQERIRADIETSKLALETHLGIIPEIFAYTYGEYTPAVIEVIKAAGFKSAFAQQSGVIAQNSDIWSLPRFPMGGELCLAGWVSYQVKNDGS